MAALLLSTYGQCNQDAFFQSQVRIKIADGREIYQCMPCSVAHENDNKGTHSDSVEEDCWPEQGACSEHTAHDRKNGGTGQQGALRQFYMHKAEAINTDLPPCEKWTLSKS
eukprot:8406905-Karenia_brevis.AAC.1